MPAARVRFEARAPAMKCPTCGGDSNFVVYTEQAEARITRRRQCERCGYRFTTAEVPVQMFQRAREFELLLVEFRAKIDAVMSTLADTK